MTQGKWYNSLRFQIVLLMSLALFPLGAIAVYQTNHIGAQTDRDAERALLAITKRAARSQEVALKSAAGVAQFVASLAPALLSDPDRCRSELASFTQANNSYSFIGVLGPNGAFACGSQNEGADFSDRSEVEKLMQTQKQAIFFEQDSPLGAAVSFNIYEPFSIEGRFGGFIFLSTSHKRDADLVKELEGKGLLGLVMFNAQTARMGASLPPTELPRDTTLEQLTLRDDTVFRGTNADGEPRVYAVTQSIGISSTALGIWRAPQSFSTTVDAFMKPAIFPVLMWFASMGVAMLSIYMLVLRHISRIQRNMDQFSKDRRMAKQPAHVVMPNEIHALTQNLERLTDGIVREEARLEDALREKSVLIKEVHHRVKNNLQLISSIMNMHIRSAQQTETKSVLSRVQDRVLSLATIHRNLYQSHDGGRVNSGELVSEIVQRSTEMGVFAQTKADVETQIDPVLLFPDQAVPLSLLVAEAMTNAIKYMGVPEAGQPAVTVSLRQTGKTCTLEIGNLVGDNPSSESTGLGGELLRAFALQLGGTIVAHDEGNQYRLLVDFPVNDFEPELRDF